jgi:phage host-nuclease inhibitor protein Gam
MAQTPDPLDRFDLLVTEISAAQARILEIVSASMAEHQAVDAKYAPRLNPLYRIVWDKFLEAQRIAEAHKDELMARGKRSSRRNTGTVGWRANTRLTLFVDEAEIVQRIKALGTAISRLLLRRRVSYELRVANIKSEENAKVVAGIEGLEVRREDIFYIDPNNGLYMSNAHPWWPTLEGVTGTRAFHTLFRDPDA